MPLRKGHFEMAISQQAKSLKIKSSLSSPWSIFQCPDALIFVSSFQISSCTVSAGNVERLLRQQRQFAKKLIKREILMTEFRN
jgi:hypothetical protein